MRNLMLVGDEEENIREPYKEEVGEEGDEVDTGASAEEAGKAVTARRPDRMIRDIGLPGRDGLEYLREVMEQRRDLPVLINSAYDSYKDDFASWAAEAYFVKSSDLEPLKLKVRELLGD